jgi:hypothetical protein
VIPTANANGSAEAPACSGERAVAHELQDKREVGDRAPLRRPVRVPLGLSGRRGSWRKPHGSCSPSVSLCEKMRTFEARGIDGT